MTNRLLERLDLEVPVLQSGMGGVAGPDLVAAVSDAGGLGILAALFLTPDQIRDGVARVRQLTGRPFGVNLWLHDELRPPRLADSLSPDDVRAVQSALNEVRQVMGLEPTLDTPPAPPDLVEEALDVLVAERVPVFSTGLGLPDGGLVERFHEVGTAVVAMVASVEDAVAAAGNGVDVVVAQGTEAGGHRSFGSKRRKDEVVGTGTLGLVPAVVDRIGDRVPVVAAGGIGDGRGLAAALVLGAEGVLLGTRFLATAESQAADAWKQRLLAPAAATVLTDAFTGQWARSVANDFTTRYEQSGAPTLPSLMQAIAAGDIFAAARAAGDAEFMPLYAGDSVAVIDDLPAAADVVARIVEEAERVLGAHAALRRVR